METGLRRRLLRVAVLAILGLYLLDGSAALAQDQWQAYSGSWLDWHNWSGQAVPDGVPAWVGTGTATLAGIAPNVAQFYIGGPQSASDDKYAEANGIVVMTNASSAELTCTGLTAVSRTGVGLLGIGGGSLTTVNLDVAHYFRGAGRVEISGTGSASVKTAQGIYGVLNVGEGGNGLLLQSGGTCETGALRLGADFQGGVGVYRLTGGSLSLGGPIWHDGEWTVPAVVIGDGEGGAGECSFCPVWAASRSATWTIPAAYWWVRPSGRRACSCKPEVRVQCTDGVSTSGFIAVPQANTVSSAGR